MHTIKGELDLYIYDKDGSLVKHHTQSNYDTFDARINPTFQDTVETITVLDCKYSAEYPRPIRYDEITVLPMYFQEPLFVPDTITTEGTDDGYFAISYNKGVNWWSHDGNTFTEVTVDTVADLRTNGMNMSDLAGIGKDQHFTKYIDHIVIKATPNGVDDIITRHDTLLLYDSSLIEPNYVRWIGPLPQLHRYDLQTYPISSNRSGNTYTINVSNLAGVNDIEIDTILTYIGSSSTAQSIGTFTYVGLTIKVDEVLVGSYTITVDTEQAVYSQRQNNAEYSFWGTSSPTFNDGVLGGTRYHGAETRNRIYSYNGGPAENKWFGPFKPDRDFLATSLNRSIGLPYTAEAMATENIIDPLYGLTTTGSVNLWSTDPNLYTNLGFAPLLYRYIFLNSGPASNTDYMLYYTNKVGTMLHYAYDNPIYYLNGNGWAGSNQQVTYRHMLKDPLNPVMWDYILYYGLYHDNIHIPRSSSNPFYDLIIEVYDERIDLRRYGREIIFSLTANLNETFKLATATLEDRPGHDLIIMYSDLNDGLTYLASIPITIERDHPNKDFIITVVGDLTDRFFVGNVADPLSSSVTSRGIYDLLNTQDALGGPWTSTVLLDEIKETTNDPYLTAVHVDHAGNVSDGTTIFDQQWDYRHLVKYGNVVTSVDTHGDQSIEFDSTSMVYLKDDVGASGYSFKWGMQRPTLSTYFEFEPDSLQDATISLNRSTHIEITAAGEVQIGTMGDQNYSLTRKRPNRFHYYRRSGPTLRTCNSYIDEDNEPIVYGFQVSSATGYTKYYNWKGWGVEKLNVDTSSWFSRSQKTFDVTIYHPDVCTMSAPYQDGSDSEIKVAKVYNSSSDLKIVKMTLNTGIHGTLTTHQVGGSAFTHAQNCITSTYTNDDDDPILVIVSGSGWNLADGIIEVNLNTDVVTKIVTSGEYYSYIYFDLEGGTGNDRHGKCVTYKDPDGDWITFAVRNPITGVIRKYNHTTGVCTAATIGPMLKESSMASIWGNGDPSSVHSTNPWSMTALPKTNICIISAGPNGVEDSTYWCVGAIDMHREVVISSNIPTRDPYYYYAPDGSYSAQQISCGYNGVGRLQGLSTSNDLMDELYIACVASCGSSISYGGSDIVHMSKVDVSGVMLEYIQNTMNYTASAVNYVGLVEYPEFSISLSDGEVNVNPMNDDNLVYSNNPPSSASLRAFNLGGVANYVSGSVTNPLSYTMDNLYEGRVKNIVLKNQVPSKGSYKFPPYTYTLGDIDSFFTNFTNTTTFLIYIYSQVNSNYYTYFLDTNNSLTLTKLDTGTYATATPNSIDEINNNLAAIEAIHGASAELGLLYYNINGDVTDVDVSQTYVKFKNVTLGAPSDYNSNGKMGGTRLFAKNGSCMYVPTPAIHLCNHRNRSVSRLDTSQNTNYTTQFDTLHLKDFTAGLLTFSTCGDSDGEGGTVLIAQDYRDNLIVQPLGRNVYPAITDAPRYIMMSDIFSDIFDMSLWSKQNNSVVHETQVFKRDGDATCKVYYHPGTNSSMDGASSQTWSFPMSIKDKIISTSPPYPVDAPAKFTTVSNAAGYEEWGSLRWYFVDGAGTSFIQDEMISFALSNTMGYAIDNWQVVNTFNMLVKGGVDSATYSHLNNTSAINGYKVNMHKRVGELDTTSTLIPTPSGDDTFYVLFDKEEDIYEP